MKLTSKNVIFESSHRKKPDFKTQKTKKLYLECVSFKCYLYKKLAYPANLFCHVKGFSRKCQEFSVSEKMYLQTFLYVNHPYDSLIMKVIDEIMGLCIKIPWCKNHDNIIFSQWENSSTIYNLIMVHPRIMKIHKTLPGDTPNDFPKFLCDWMYEFWIHWVQTNKQTQIHFYIYVYTS